MRGYKYIKEEEKSDIEEIKTLLLDYKKYKLINAVIKLIEKEKFIKEDITYCYLKPVKPEVDSNQDSSQVNLEGKVFILLDGRLAVGDIVEVQGKEYFVERLILKPGDIVGEVEAEAEIDGFRYLKTGYKSAIRPTNERLNRFIAYTDDEFKKAGNLGKIKILFIKEEKFKELLKNERYFAYLVFKNSYMKERRYISPPKDPKNPDDIADTLVYLYTSLKNVNLVEKTIGGEDNVVVIYPPGATFRLNAIVGKSGYFERREERPENLDNKHGVKINIYYADFPLLFEEYGIDTLKQWLNKDEIKEFKNKLKRLIDLLLKEKNIKNKVRIEDLDIVVGSNTIELDKFWRLMRNWKNLSERIEKVAGSREILSIVEEIGNLFAKIPSGKHDVIVLNYTGIGGA